MRAKPAKADLDSHLLISAKIKIGIATDAVSPLLGVLLNCLFYVHKYTVYVVNQKYNLKTLSEKSL